MEMEKICDAIHFLEVAHHDTPPGAWADHLLVVINRIKQMQDVINQIESLPDNIAWGWDGDCGISTRISAIIQTLDEVE